MSGLRIAAFGVRALHGVEGGVETHARELYPRLAAMGCLVTVLTRARYEAASGGAVITHPLPAPGGDGIEAAVHALLATFACVVRRPDIVHVHGIGPAVFTPLLRLCGLRVVMTHHGHDYDATKWGRLARLALRIAERVGVRTANAVITVSKTLRGDVLRNFGVEADAIYNGYSAFPEHAPSPSSELGALSTCRYVLVVGRLTPHKRIEDAIAAFASLPHSDLRLVVCGKLVEGNAYCERLRTLSAGNERVLLAGYVPPELLPWLYRHAVCTVMTSSYEGMPLAVLEAIGNGSRVVLSDIPAHIELELPAACYYAVGDVDALAQRLRATLDAVVPVQPRTLGREFDWSTIAQQTLAVMERVAGARAGLRESRTCPRQ